MKTARALHNEWMNGKNVVMSVHQCVYTSWKD